jgi:hypothetical protein
MSYLVPQQPGTYSGTIRRFEPAYWEIDCNIECSSTIVTSGSNSFVVKASFILTHDIIGVYWRSSRHAKLGIAPLNEKARQRETASMNEDEKQEIFSSYAAGFVAQSYVIFSVIGAMIEKGLVDPDRIIAWAETFSSGFDQNSSLKENAEIAALLRDFAKSMRLIITKPAGAGTT